MEGKNHEGIALRFMTKSSLANDLAMRAATMDGIGISVVGIYFQHYQSSYLYNLQQTFPTSFRSNPSMSMLPFTKGPIQFLFSTHHHSARYVLHLVGLVVNFFQKHLVFWHERS